MNISINYILLLTTMIISGCSSCPVQTFYKVTPMNQTRDVHSYTNGRKHAVIEIDHDVTIDITNCYDTALCAEITLPEGRRFQFSSDEFMKLDPDSHVVIETQKADKIYYSVTCEQVSATERRCNSSEAPPVAGDVKLYRSSGYPQFYKHSFSSTLEFIGASETKGQLSYKLFSYKGQRTYQLPAFIKNKTDTKPYILRFPMVMIDGKPYTLPDILIAKVKEPLCSHKAW
ncbi:MAG: hypothetical protein P4L42_01650 [Desulfocapsaceae bacterium]|nr:hypothetical protein [Desulfocapsaceae bacterium]